MMKNVHQNRIHIYNIITTLSNKFFKILKKTDTYSYSVCQNVSMLVLKKYSCIVVPGRLLSLHLGHLAYNINSLQSVFLFGIVLQTPIDHFYALLFILKE